MLSTKGQIPLRIQTGNRPGNLGRVAGSSRSAGGAAFMPAGMDETPRAATVAPAMAAAGLDALLALQAVDNPLEGQRRAVRRGRSLLDVLDGLKADLLVGRLDGSQLDRLTSLLGELRENSLPALDAVLDEIDLRAQVELAKLGRFSA